MNSQDSRLSWRKYQCLIVRFAIRKFSRNVAICWVDFSFEMLLTNFTDNSKEKSLHWKSYFIGDAGGKRRVKRVRYDEHGNEKTIQRKLFAQASILWPFRYNCFNGCHAKRWHNWLGRKVDKKAFICTGIARTNPTSTRLCYHKSEYIGFVGPFFAFFIRYRSHAFFKLQNYNVVCECEMQRTAEPPLCLRIYTFLIDFYCTLFHYFFPFLSLSSHHLWNESMKHKSISHRRTDTLTIVRGDDVRA